MYSRFIIIPFSVMSAFYPSSVGCILLIFLFNSVGAVLLWKFYGLWGKDVRGKIRMMGRIESRVGCLSEWHIYVCILLYPDSG